MFICYHLWWIKMYSLLTTRHQLYGRQIKTALFVFGINRPRCITTVCVCTLIAYTLTYLPTYLLTYLLEESEAEWTDLVVRCYQRRSDWCVRLPANSSSARVGTETGTQAVRAGRRAGRTAGRPGCGGRRLADRRRGRSASCTAAATRWLPASATTRRHAGPANQWRSLRPDTCRTFRVITIYSLVQKSGASAHFCFFLWNALHKSDIFLA